MRKNSASDRYLLAIHTLKEQYLCVRSVDLAHFLSVSKASVSALIRQMREQGLIEVAPDGNLQFTSLGERRINLLNGRVNFFRQTLIDAGVEPALALQDALSFSWEMSEESYNALKALLEVGIRQRE